MSRRVASAVDDVAHGRGSATESNPVGIQVIDRAVALLQCFTLETPALGVGELSRSVGISKGTAHRLLAALQAHRLIDQDPETRRYRLGFGLFDLGSRVIARLDSVEAAHPYLQALVRETGETAHLAILDQGTAYYVAKVEGSRSLRMPSQVGRRNPIHCTAVGKVLAAYLPKDEVKDIVREHGLPRHTPNTITTLRRLTAELTIVRSAGYAVDKEEIELGLRCVAAPVRDYSGRVIAAISASGPVTRITDAALDSYAAQVRGAARSISRALGADVDSGQTT